MQYDYLILPGEMVLVVDWEPNETRFLVAAVPAVVVVAAAVAAASQKLAVPSQIHPSIDYKDLSRKISKRSPLSLLVSAYDHKCVRPSIFVFLSE